MQSANLIQTIDTRSTGVDRGHWNTVRALPVLRFLPAVRVALPFMDL